MAINRKETDQPKLGCDEHHVHRQAHDDNEQHNPQCSGNHNSFVGHSTKTDCTSIPEVVPKSDHLAVPDPSDANQNSFLSQISDLIINQSKIVGHPDWIRQHNDKVINFKQPAELEKIFQLKVDEKPFSRQKLIDFCQKVIQYSPITSHPLFCNQLYAGVDQYGLAGAWLTDALNPSQATYEIAPVFSLLERESVKFLANKLEWSSDDVDGLFCPGGSLANITGVLCARHFKCAEIKQNGLWNMNKMVLFVSETSHYSFVKGAIWMGMGSESVIKVPTDNRGKMSAVALRQLIQQSLNSGQIPFMVVCTSATTVLASFDPIDQVRTVCDEFQMWLHVDAALGGTYMFSPKLKHFMQGIKYADSVTWNLHKMAGVPMQCSAFLVQHKRILTDAIGLKAEYLFQNDRFYDPSYDLGDKTIQCGRKVDSLKLWLHLISKGESGLRQDVEHVHEMVTWFTHQLSQRPRFKLVLPEFEGNTICFWYVPESIDQIADQDERNRKLHLVCPAIKQRMMERGMMMVNYQPLTCKKLPNFFRMVITCVPSMSTNHLGSLIDEIDCIGRQLYPN